MPNPKFPISKNTHHPYRADIDGLRAIAILSVIMFHFFPAFLTGGYVGVDVFFVISGFLITNIIIKAKDNFSYLDFYTKRVLRIFPALVTVLAFSLIVGWNGLFADEFASLGKHVLRAGVFLSNIQLLRETGYFDVAADTKPLLMLWSLAIEEQFYLIWPTILGALLFLHKKKIGNISYLLILLIAISFLWNTAKVSTHPSAAFYLPMTRAWELGVGALCSFVFNFNPKLTKPSEFTSNILSFVGLALIILAAVFLTDTMLFPGYWALMPTVGAVLLIYSSETAWINRILLASKPFVFIGLISYPLYLWHWPLLTFTKLFFPEHDTPSLLTAVLLLSFVLAYLTYKFIETPIRFGKNKQKRALGLVMGMFVVCVGGFLVKQSTIRAFNNQALLPSWVDMSPLNKEELEGRAFYTTRNDRPVQVLYIGDSNMEQYIPRITHLSADNNAPNVAMAFQPGCPPIDNVLKINTSGNESCSNFMAVNQKYIDAHPEISRIVLAASWDILESSIYVYKDGESEYPLPREGAALALAQLQRTIEQWQSQRDIEVMLVLNIPNSNKQDPNLLLKRQFALTSSYSNKDPELALPLKSAEIESQRGIRAPFVELAEKTNITLIDPFETLCKGKYCQLYFDKNKIIYRDPKHLNPKFTENHANFIDITMMLS